MKKIPKIIKEIRKHKPIEIDYKSQISISYSQFSMFNSCSHKWGLQYKDNHKFFTSTVSTVFGTAIHETVQHYLTVMYEESGVAADDVDVIGMFEEKLRNEYKKQYLGNNKQHFSTPQDLREHYEDGVEILETLTKKRGEYFSKQGWFLVGCEIPILINPHIKYPNILFKGFIDLVLYHEPTNTFKIFDFKTSTRSWDDKQKKDENKQFQLILYKHFFSEQFKVPIDNIEIEFFILKRKLWEKSEYAQSRIQLFSPPSGKIKTKKATENLTNFIETVFDEKGYKDQQYPPNPTKMCKYCPFYKTDLCTATL